MRGQKKKKKGKGTQEARYSITQAEQRGLSDCSFFQSLKITAGKKSKEQLAQKPWKMSSKKRE